MCSARWIRSSTSKSNIPLAALPADRAIDPAARPRGVRDSRVSPRGQAYAPAPPPRATQGARRRRAIELRRTTRPDPTAAPRFPGAALALSSVCARAALPSCCAPLRPTPRQFHASPRPLTPSARGDQDGECRDQPNMSSHTVARNPSIAASVRDPKHPRNKLFFAQFQQLATPWHAWHGRWHGARTIDQRADAQTRNTTHPNP